MTNSALGLDQLPGPLREAVRAKLEPGEQVLWGARHSEIPSLERTSLLSKAVREIFYIITNKRALMFDEEYNVTPLTSAQLLKNVVEAKKAVHHLLRQGGQGGS
jgi:hypothetical protein